MVALRLMLPACIALILTAACAQSPAPEEDAPMLAAAEQGPQEESVVVSDHPMCERGVRLIVNPLVATFGGVFGPILMYFVFLNMFDAAGAFKNSDYTYDDLTKGWGITTATDISLGWATALMVFGPGHPGVCVDKQNSASASTLF